MNHMHILLITDSYPPEIRSASHLMQELAEGFRDRGHKITVVTSYPQYNLTEEHKSTVFPEVTNERGVTIIRVKTLPHHKVNFIVRGLSQLTMPYIFLSRVRKYVTDRIDVVLVYSPPLPLAKVGAIIKRKYGAQFILNIQDIFPQNAIDLGALRNSLLMRFFERMETKAYSSADVITVHSEGNREFLLARKNVQPKKLIILHNWIDVSSHDGQRTGAFRKLYGLDGKFIFLFAGVIGPSQGLDLIIDIARKVQNIPDICFLIVGDGMEKERLVAMMQKYALTNVVFRPFVSKQEYPRLVKDADVGLVCLTSKNKTPVVPGKILGYMAAAIPVVAFLNRESDGHEIIRRAQCGYSAVSDDPVVACEIIHKIFHEKDKLQELGENGLHYVRENFDKQVCLNKLENCFKSIS